VILFCYKHVIPLIFRQLLYPRNLLYLFGAFGRSQRKIIDDDLIIVKDGSRPATNPTRSRPRGSGRHLSAILTAISWPCQWVVLARHDGPRVPKENNQSHYMDCTSSQSLFGRLILRNTCTSASSCSRHAWTRTDAETRAMRKWDAVVGQKWSKTRLPFGLKADDPRAVCAAATMTLMLDTGAAPKCFEDVSACVIYCNVHLLTESQHCLIQNRTEALLARRNHSNKYNSSHSGVLRRQWTTLYSDWLQCNMHDVNTC